MTGLMLQLGGDDSDFRSLRLESDLRFQVGDDVFEAGPGAGVLAPKGTPRAYGNAHRGRVAATCWF